MCRTGSAALEIGSRKGQGQEGRDCHFHCWSSLLQGAAGKCQPGGGMAEQQILLLEVK